MLRDGYESYENGLQLRQHRQRTVRMFGPHACCNVQNVLFMHFDRDESTRKQQDVGLDGLGNDDEKVIFHQLLIT